MPAITMKQVAAAAGVHPSTVSLALRAHPSIPPATCRRIQQVARRLGYVRNPAVSALMSNLRRREATPAGSVLAYLNAWQNRGHMRADRSLGPIFRGAEARAAELGFRLEEIWTKEPRLSAARLRSILVHRGIEGVIVGPMQAQHGHLSLDLSPFACSAVGFSLWRPDLHRASPNYAACLTLAVRQLRHRGYRRIAFFEPVASDKWLYHQWVAGYLVCQHAGLTERLPPHVWSQWDLAETRAWIAQHQPDAILSPQPWVGEILLREKLIAPAGPLAFALLNWRDDHPRFSGIDQNLENVGATAVELAVEGIHLNRRGAPLSPKVVQTPGRWVEAESSPSRSGVTQRLNDLRP